MTDHIVSSAPSSLFVGRSSAPSEPPGGTTHPQTGSGAPTGPSFGEILRDAAQSIGRGQARVDRAIRRGAHGETDPGRLLALQAGVYRYTQELELASKLVDKATSAVKTTLQSQQ